MLLATQRRPRTARCNRAFLGYRKAFISTSKNFRHPEDLSPWRGHDFSRRN